VTAQGQITLARAHAALDEERVSWCLLRAPSIEGRDVDVLVAKGDLNRAISRLCHRGFAELMSRVRGSRRLLVAYDSDADRWLELDVASELAFGPRLQFATRAAAGVLERRARPNGVPVPSPDDEFWALLLHCLLDHRAIAERHRRRLSSLAPSAGAGNDLARAVGPLLPSGWDADRLVASARDSQWDALAALAPALARRWARRRASAVTARLLESRVDGVARRLRPPFGARGLDVALLGPDGAGKTTLAAALAASFYLPARSVYLGLFPKYLHHRRYATLPVLRFVTLLSRLGSGSLRGGYHVARGRLVVFDRHSYDALAGSRPPGWLLRARRWLVVHACSAPDTVVVLDAPAEVCHHRKGEETVEQLSEQRRRFLELAGRRAEIDVIDAGKDADAVRRAVTALLWRRYSDRRPAGTIPGDGPERLARADFRFLLPYPSLGAVLCVGVGDADLVAALRLVARRVVSVARAAQAPAGTDWDLVVLDAPRQAALADAAPLVRPGGFVYVETHGALGRPKQLGRSSHASACAATLDRLRFEEADHHLHWPSISRCWEIVPLRDPAAVRAMLARRRMSLRERAAAAVLRPLPRGLPILLAPGVSVLARRPPSDSEGRS
jgi:thymidylate kinase